MAILAKEAFLAKIKERIGDSTDEKDIEFVEDMVDTYSDLAGKANTDYKAKYEELKATYDRDKADMLRKYRERFFTPEDTNSDGTETDVVDEAAGIDERTVDTVEEKPVKYDDLFD